LPYFIIYPQFDPEDLIMPSPSSLSSPQTFQCPTCGASLPVPDDDLSIKCEYCGSTVFVPPEYRHHSQNDLNAEQAPIIIQISGSGEPETANSSEAQQRNARLITSVVGIVVLLCVIGGILAAIAAAAGAFTTASVVSEAVNQAASLPAVTTEIAIPLLTVTPSPNPDYSISLQFGAEGTGPGKLEDARYLAIDPGGDIHTAEYQEGRLQKFDPSGKFLQLTMVQPDKDNYTTISDLASDYNGRLLVARRGDILIYDAADGALLGNIPGKFPDTRYEALAVDPANTIYALHVAAGVLDLIKLDPNGQVLWRKPQVTAGLVKNTEISTVRRLAVDGLGYSYLLDDSQNQVYKFDATGNFVDRFGSKGDGPSLLENPEDLIVDGQGRIYILDQDGIEVFDNRGAHLKLIPDDYQGHAFDIKLDLQGNVYIITNAPQVYKLKINLGE
jgi:DNA-directed RNA polymerase subunit RPC12/RpoP